MNHQGLQVGKEGVDSARPDGIGPALGRADGANHIQII
jgi:hypothetical protein